MCQHCGCGDDNTNYVYAGQALKYEKCIKSILGHTESLALRIAALPDQDRDVALKFIAGFECSDAWIGSPRASLLQEHRGDPACEDGPEYPGIALAGRTRETKEADQP